MRVLVVGGTRFMGYGLVWQLLFAGHRVTVLNRGTHPDPFGDRVERLVADRTTPELARALTGREFDAAVDFAAYTAADTRGVIEALAGRLGQYVFISTGSIYAVRQDCPLPSREGDYAGPVMPESDDPSQVPDWQYGVDKRAAEDVLIEAWERDRFPSTRIRIPVVNGERDPSRRLESYLWRILDGKPVVLPDAGRRLRQVYSGSVVLTIAGLLGKEITLGQAYNLCQDEIPTLSEVVDMCADLMGAPVRIVPVARETFGAASLDSDALFPFTSRWNSILDPGKAKLELRFQHTPLRTYLGRIVAAFLAYLPEEPPEYYQHRAQEVALAHQSQF